VIGQRGSVRWDGQQQFAAQVVKSTGGFHSELENIEIPTLHDPAKTGGHEGLIREFVTSVRSNQLPETVSSDNIHSLSMVHAAIRSAETGQRVLVSQV
jgi:predicted dehydrogenase